MNVRHCSWCGLFFAFAMLWSQNAAASIVLGKAAQFGILGLNDGTVIINSAKSIQGNVGYSNRVISNTNQKVDSFIGAAYVHSGATFTRAAATFNPSDGILTGASVDALLNQANADAVAASTAISSLTATHTFGDLMDNQSQVITSVGGVNVVAIASVDFKEDFLTFMGGANDLFYVNVAGDFDFSASEIRLNGVQTSNIIWNFTNASPAININKAETVFRGTILATTGSVDYHNPATFEGAIIAKDINLHSDFNFKQDSFHPVPEPQSLLIWTAVALVGVCRCRSTWRKRK